tara:strand:- start:3081 stop:3785 length:705 start_codon:yes stop_codon:yes gene_type:complete
MKNVIFIFARSGSKGLKNKNIKNFNGKPLLYWTIQQAKKIKNIDSIILSTDSKKIATIGKKFGANIFFLRPKKLATDRSPEWLSWQHATKFIENKFKTNLEKIVVLPITSPCRKVKDINACIKLYETKKFDSTMVISRTSLHPAFNLVNKNKINQIQLIDTKSKFYRRQQFKNSFKLTTVALVTNSSTILNNKRIFDGNVGGVEIPSTRAIDIDTIEDFLYCEYLFKKKRYDRF